MLLNRLNFSCGINQIPIQILQKNAHLMWICLMLICAKLLNLLQNTILIYKGDLAVCFNLMLTEDKIWIFFSLMVLISHTFFELWKTVRLSHVLSCNSLTALLNKLISFHHFVHSWIETHIVQAKLFRVTNNKLISDDSRSSAQKRFENVAHLLFQLLF